MGEPGFAVADVKDGGSDVLGEQARRGDCGTGREPRTADDERHVQRDFVRTGFRSRSASSVLAVVHPVVAREDDDRVFEHRRVDAVRIFFTMSSTAESSCSAPIASFWIVALSAFVSGLRA